MQKEDLEIFAPYLNSSEDCTVCGSGDKGPWARIGSYRAVMCQRCGLIWIDPTLDNVGLERYYANYIGKRFEDKDKTSKRSVQYDLDRNFIQSFIQSGVVLDVGCSGGFFLNRLSRGFEKHGIELDTEAVSYAHKSYTFGRNIEQRSLFELEPEQRTFDLIIMRGVLEHLTRPRQAVQKVWSLLNPGGFFYIAATPNAASLAAKIYRGKWHLFHPIRHLYYFSPNTLNRMMQPIGFKLIGKQFPYYRTPYASPVTDILKITRDLILRGTGRFNNIGTSRAFWGSIMNLVYIKQADSCM